MGYLFNISIGRRVFFSFALTTVITLVAISLLSTYFFDALVARDQAVKTAFAAQHTANDQLVNLQRMNALLRTRFAQVFATTGGSLHDPSLEASGGLIAIDILTREVDFGQTLPSYQQNYALATSNNMSDVRSIVFNDDPNSAIGVTQQSALTTVAKSEWPRYRSLQDQILQLLDPTTNPTLLTNPGVAYEQAYSLLFQDNILFLTLTNDWQQVVDSAQTIGEIVTNVGPSQYLPILISTTIALFLTLSIIVLIGYTVNLTITYPLKQLVELTQRIAKGENQVRAKVRGRDEIARVAHSMNGMLDNIVQLIEESEGQRAQLQFQVEQLAHDVGGVSFGDLRARATVTLPDLGTLATSFNSMISAFSSLIRQVKTVAYQVVASTMQVSQLMSQLVTSAKHQIDQIQDASSEIERMVGAGRRVADNASRMSAVAINARQSSQEGEASVRQTETGMREINEVMGQTVQKVHSLQMYSSVIEEISTIMGGIAQKTQRLSLDAAIQASIASANNAGFSQVAEQIRDLADQAKREAERITRVTHTIIQEITAVQQATLMTAHKTESMERFASQTGAALASIFQAVQHQADEIQQMAQVAEAQVQSSQKVGEVMYRVSQATRQSSIVTENVSILIQKQGQLVLHLRTSVEAFRISDEQGSAPAPTRYMTGSNRSHQ